MEDMTELDHAAPIRPIDEASEFVASLFDASPRRLTACRGWTVHEVTAHLAAGSEEIADLIESHLAGAEPRATRSFEEREAPYRTMDDPELRRLLFEQVERAGKARECLAHHVDDVVLFTGRAMHASEFVTHSRSERALHRWDIVGRDEIGWEMLAQPELTVHALKILVEMTDLGESFANRLQAAFWPSRELVVTLRSEPHDDVVITVSGSVVSAQAEPVGDRRVDAHLEPAARLLALWGRREPSAPVHFEGGASRDALSCLFNW